MLIYNKSYRHVVRVFKVVFFELVSIKENCKYDRYKKIPIFARGIFNEILKITTLLAITISKPKSEVLQFLSKFHSLCLGKKNCKILKFNSNTNIYVSS